MKHRTNEAQTSAVGQALCAEGTEIGLKAGFFLSVKENRQAQSLIDGTHIGFAALGDEVVAVLADVAQKAVVPKSVVTGFPGDIALHVEVAWIVIALLLKCAQNIRVVAVADAGVVGEPFVFADVFKLQRCPKHAHRKRTRELRRSSV